MGSARDSETILHETIEKLLREQLGEDKIGSVSVEKDVDFDGDEILRVTIAITARRARLDATKTSGLVRRLRPQLARLGEMAFPILTFVAASELKGENAAA